MAASAAIYRYEPRRLRFEEAAIAAMLTATPGVLAALVVGLPWAIPAAAATALAVAVAVRRAFRLALVATSERVTVRNYWRTYDFTWLDVRTVGVGLIAMGRIPVPALHFDLRSGRAVRAQAIPHDALGQSAALDALQALAPPTVEFVRAGQLTRRAVDGREPDQRDRLVL